MPTVERLLAEGKTLMLVAVDGRAAGVVAAADMVRPTPACAIAELKALGIQPVMMTGDNHRTAEAVARQVGIGRVFAEVLLQDKAEGMRRLQAEGRFTAMVGDGVNDAPPRPGRRGHRHRGRHRRGDRDRRRGADEERPGRRAGGVFGCRR